jgi:hypothetical protein
VKETGVTVMKKYILKCIKYIHTRFLPCIIIAFSRTPRKEFIQKLNSGLGIKNILYHQRFQTGAQLAFSGFVAKVELP